MKIILGISAYYHDSAAALLVDGEIISCAQEERFSRKKGDASFPTEAIKYCLKEANISISDVNDIVFFEKPFLKFERLLETYIAFAPRGFKSFAVAMPLWLKQKLFQKRLIINELKKIDKNKCNFDDKLNFSEHHYSHAASAFFPSPYKKAVVLTVDGVGEWATSTYGIGEENNLNLYGQIDYPHSLGLLYSSFTYFLGFTVNSGEYKVMGLAPYGKPIYKDLILEKIIDVKDDGSFFLDQKYFNYSTGLEMISKNFLKLFNAERRIPESEITDFHMDIAASIQAVVEEVMLKITKNLYKKYNIENLCLAGGVALNCVANGKILRESGFKNIWVQPAAGDAGGALGAAYSLWYLKYKMKRKIIEKTDSMKGSYLGPSFSNIEIKSFLEKNNIDYNEYDDKTLLTQTANELKMGKSVGWFQGRMEFGPRALGSRSILGDPRSETMQKNMNLKIKFRESFRPFAPAILNEHLKEWFNINSESPYMLFVTNILEKHFAAVSEKDKNKKGIDLLNIKRSSLPATTHVDYSSRIQTVHKETNLKFYNLLKEFYEQTNCPVLINTSFNVRGEPIVCSIQDAYNCFTKTNLDILVCGNYILKK
jgi:carbamoyltransferase